MSTRIPSADALADLPLLDEAAIIERLAAVVQGAFRRQAWFLLLDARKAQLPIVIPMDLPRRPEGDSGEALGRLLETLSTLEEVAEIAVVYERPGPDLVTDDDLVWLIGIEDASGHTDLPVHGPFFATDTGIRRWKSHHDVDANDVMMQEWPHEDDDHPHAGGAGARGGRDA
ncbi:MAG TPA: hypothetical protein VNQ52_05980 [Microbacteriaceae bacterium]|nr:hypothetical protein [Microbacteriaceae bacterium]